MCTVYAYTYTILLILLYRAFPLAHNTTDFTPLVLLKCVTYSFILQFYLPL